MNKAPVTLKKRKPAAPLREEVGRFSAVLVGVASGHTCGGFGDGVKNGGTLLPFEQKRQLTHRIWMTCASGAYAYSTVFHQWKSGAPL
jgi:hypothetical protein